MEHYTKNTEACTAFCKKCGRDTQHRVDGGRRGPCLEHEAPKFSAAQIRRQKAAAKAALRGPGLFDGEK